MIISLFLREQFTVPVVMRLFLRSVLLLTCLRLAVGLEPTWPDGKPRPINLNRGKKVIRWERDADFVERSWLISL